MTSLASAGDGISLSAGAGDYTYRAEVAWFRETSVPRWQFHNWQLRCNLEADLAYWKPSGARDEGRSITEAGLTPVFRLSRLSDESRFFVEAAVGVHFLSHTSIYRGREFSTSFQFGDLIGAGWRFGQRREYEVSLRLQHFSNAGIAHPNQGIEFAILRFARRFDARGQT
ncbi:MAG: acyloxyacyl hydrolase [Burkholderiales bacterium]